MSLTATDRLEASVEVGVRVPRGDSADLETGVADVLANVDGVDAVDVDAVSNVRPTWTDVRIDVAATVAVAVPDDGDPPRRVAAAVLDDGDTPRCIAAALREGFGVTDVYDVAVTGAVDAERGD